MAKRKARNSKLTFLKASAITTLEDFQWLRLAGLEAPRLREHAELVVQETRKTWETNRATPRQERFLRLRGQWQPGLTQKQAFDRIGTIADLEQQELGASKKPTWRRLVELEPRLQDLFAEAEREPPAGEVYCAAMAWYGWGGLKARMCDLVGNGAEQPGLLATSPAYDVAYDTLLEVLPDCDPECACGGF
jgi:hypothetical protein